MLGCIEQFYSRFSDEDRCQGYDMGPGIEPGFDELMEVERMTKHN